MIKLVTKEQIAFLRRNTPHAEEVYALVGQLVAEGEGKGVLVAPSLEKVTNIVKQVCYSQLCHFFFLLRLSSTKSLILFFQVISSQLLQIGTTIHFERLFLWSYLITHELELDKFILL